MLPSCSTVPITERKQLSIIPESRINRQAAAAYEKFRNKVNINEYNNLNISVCEKCGIHIYEMKSKSKKKE